LLDNRESKLNNNGFSLVELITIIAILVVAVGAVGINSGLLYSAEVKQAGQKMIAVLNDAKTGNFTRAGEEIVVRYISVDGKKDEWAKKGVDSSGFYGEKSIYTIMNDATNIKQAYSVDREYTSISQKKITITFVTSSGSYVISDSAAVRISFDRKTGALKELEAGSITGDTFTGTKVGEIQEITFELGSRKKTITVDAKQGRYSLD